MKIVLKRGQAENVEFYKYPDGQQNCKLDMEHFNDTKDHVEIECSIRNFGELEQLLCLASALKKNDFYVSSLDFKFLFGLRSDRAFEVGMPNYFRDIVAPIVNSIGAHRIELFHPHSQVAGSYLEAAQVQMGFPNLRAMVPNLDDFYILGGDKTAGTSNLRRGIHLHGWFEKERRLDGIHVHLPEATLEFLKENKKPILIVDDLCDGGGTFIAIANYLKEHLPEYSRNLLVSHAIFSKGAEHVIQHFDNVFTTNSWQDFDVIPNLHVTEVI